MASADGTILTDRQVEVLSLRAAGCTQREAAARIGTSGSNVSSIERAAMANIEKARNTVDLAETITAESTFTVAAGTHFGDLVDMVYSTADAESTKVNYCRPELYAHLYDLVAEHTEGSKIRIDLTIGLESSGDVCVHRNRTEERID